MRVRVVRSYDARLCRRLGSDEVRRISPLLPDDTLRPIVHILSQERPYKSFKGCVRLIGVKGVVPPGAAVNAEGGR